jgi:hypothetical protein
LVTDLKGRSIQPYSELDPKHKQLRVELALSVLAVLAGDNSVAEKNELVLGIAEQQGYELTQYTGPGPDRRELIDRIATAYRACGNRHSDRALCVQLMHDVSRENLRSLYRFDHLGKDLLKSVRSAVGTYGYGPIEIGQGGRQQTKPEIVQQVHEMFVEQTRTASRSEKNQHLRGKKDEGELRNPDDDPPEEMRILEKPRSHVCAEISDKGITSYGNAWAISKCFEWLKLGKCMTDKCHVCHDGNTHEVQEKRWVTYFMGLYPDAGIAKTHGWADLVACKSLKDHEKTFCFGNLLKALEYSTHRAIKDYVRVEGYDKDREEIKSLEALFLMLRVDYMGSVETGVGPINLENAYYGHSAVSVLGFAYWVPGMEKPDFQDFVSDNLSHNSAVSEMQTRRMLEKIKSRHPNLDFTKLRLKLWADVGRHFLSSMYIHGVCNRIREDYGFIEVTIDFFPPMHGKGINDIHFSVANRAVRQYSLKARILNAKSVETAFTNYHEGTVETRARRKQQPGSNWYVEEYGETDAGCATHALVLTDRILQNLSFTIRTADPKVVEVRALTRAPKFEALPVQIVKARRRGGAKREAPSATAPPERVLPERILQSARAFDVWERGLLGAIRAPGAAEQEGDTVENESLTRWARDAAPEATTNHPRLHKYHRHVREACTGLGIREFTTIDWLADQIQIAEEAQSAVLASAALALPEGTLAAQRKFVKERLKIPGQGASFLHPLRNEEGGSWTLCTLEGPNVDNPQLIDLVWHHGTKPEHESVLLSQLALCVVPTRGRPSGRLLSVNHYEPDTPAPPQITLYGTVIEHDKLEFGCWALCGKCRRWRVIPREVWIVKKKRGVKFECSDALPQGCVTARRAIEEEAAWAPR